MTVQGERKFQKSGFSKSNHPTKAVKDRGCVWQPGLLISLLLHLLSLSPSALQSQFSESSTVPRTGVLVHSVCLAAREGWQPWQLHLWSVS